MALQQQTTRIKISLNESQIAEQFAIYTQLYNENKISVKNVWSLPIIDLLQALCQKTNGNVLQVVSKAINICAKVNGLRVDDLHSQELKLAADLARSHKNDEEQNNEEENDNEEGGNLNQSTKKKLPKMEPVEMIDFLVEPKELDKLDELDIVKPVTKKSATDADVAKKSK